jgi:hypothetical protein
MRGSPSETTTIAADTLLNFVFATDGRAPIAKRLDRAFHHDQGVPHSVPLVSHCGVIPRSRCR